MKRLMLALFLLCSTVPLFASIDIEPRRVFAGDEVVVHIRGFWDGGFAIPRNPVVAIDGATITIDLAPPPASPISAGVEWGVRVPIGRLAAGTYQIVVVGRSPETRPLVVEGGPFRVFRTLTESRQPGILIRGIAAPVCDGHLGCDLPVVRFNDVPSRSVIVTEDHDIIAEVPDNGSGVVDVTVSRSNGDVLTVPNAYRYDALLNEEDDYERVLFHLNLVGRGAHG
jgi:hypothetical protein